MDGTNIYDVELISWLREIIYEGLRVSNDKEGLIEYLLKEVSDEIRNENWSVGVEIHDLYVD